MPDGFDINNSPAELARRGDVHRPLVMLSSLGTSSCWKPADPQWRVRRLLPELRRVARHLAPIAGSVAVVGAGSRGEFREEDQMCCAWVAEILVNAGHRPEDARTVEIIERWRGAPATSCGTGNSAAYLRRSGQLRDLEFVTTHVDDLDIVCSIEGNEVRPLRGLLPSTTAAD